MPLGAILGANLLHDTFYVRSLEPLRPILGASRGILGPSWEPLGASWDHPGSISGPSWSILEHLTASWAHLGNILGPLEAILGADLLHDTLYVRAS